MLNWLARKGGGSTVPARYSPAWLMGLETAEGPRSYEARARAAMHRNPVAYRAVRLIAESVGGCPLDIAIGKSSAGPLPTSPAGGGGDVAALLARPNSRTSRAAFFERVAAHLVLHGNAYVEAALDGSGRPAELHVLAPERVRVETDSAGWPSHFLYRAGSREVRLPVPSEEAGGVLHIRALSPLDEHYGLGSLEAASGAIHAHEEASKWNRALLQNAARPSGALMAGGESGDLSGEQFDRLRKEMDEGFSGAMKAGRPLLLEGGLKWVPLSLSPADMDFAEGQARAAREIALALGVPPLLLGMPGDNTYANYAEANRALWRQTVLPLAGRIASELTTWLGFWWPGASVSVAEDKVSALAADRAKLWEQVSRADFLGREEKRKLLGIEAQT